MTNAELSEAFNHIARLKELLDQEIFRVVAYQRTAIAIDKLTRPVSEMTPAEIETVLGKSMSQKAVDILKTGTLREWQELQAQVPDSVLEMFEVPGLGVKKIRALWRDYEIDSLDKLKEKASSGEFAKLPGFGSSMQEKVLSHFATKAANRGKLRFNHAEQAFEAIELTINTHLPSANVVPTGQLSYFENTVNHIEAIVELDNRDRTKLVNLFEPDPMQSGPDRLHFELPESGTPVTLRLAKPGEGEAFGLLFSLPPEERAARLSSASVNNGQFFIKASSPEREGLIKTIAPESVAGLVQQNQIVGMLHCHSTYSDGQETLANMADRCLALGYQYFGICDHSRTASYANGLSIETVEKQWLEIETINKTFSGLRILKGIESDILSDGALDYPDDILAGFEFVVASVHSNLTMNLVKATDRMLAAIHNPYTSILGHPTGRLLLEREGYPLDWPVILEACATLGVVVELNASPYRLDIDYTILQQAQETGCFVAINTDAHSYGGLNDIRYGIMAARRGGLLAENVINTWEADRLLTFFQNRRKPHA